MNKSLCIKNLNNLVYSTLAGILYSNLPNDQWKKKSVYNIQQSKITWKNLNHIRPPRKIPIFQKIQHPHYVQQST